MNDMRASLAFFAALLSVATLFSPCSRAEECVSVWEPWDYSRTDTLRVSQPVGEGGPQAVSPQRVLGAWLIAGYQVGVSPVNGKHCPMHPSCSAYAADAVKSGGVLGGVLMAFDRLHRCGHDLRFYETVYVDGEPRYYDPVPLPWARAR